MHRMPGAAVDELHIGPRQSIRAGHAFNFAALSRDGKWLGAANPEAGAVSIHEVRNPTNHFNLLSQPSIQCPAISPDGRWVAAGNFKGSGVKVWDFESRRVVCTLPTPSSAVVGFSPDNRWLGVGGVSFDLWETGTWKRKYTFSRNRSDLMCACAFSPDARLLAIGDDPGLIHLVATDSAELLANLEAPFRTVISFLRFSADGSQLFALQWDQQVQIWDLRRLRAELAKLNLDWTGPPIFAEAPSQIHAPKPLHISLVESLR
jgi:WD40 repeat protein